MHQDYFIFFLHAQNMAINCSLKLYYNSISEKKSETETDSIRNDAFVILKM